jgi:lipopolysaccharide cholinephosphotransferase
MKNKFLEQYKQQTLRTCQLKQLHILEEIDAICRRHDIEYWLDGGTLLGAVRHGGFIPWDDDIDIAMRKEDMHRFCEIAHQELSDDLFLQTPENEPDVKEQIVKVRDLNSFYVEPSDNFSASYQKGLYVDIFPMEKYPTISRTLAKSITLGVSKSWSILRKSHYYSLRSFAEFFWFSAKYALCRLIWAIICKIKPKDTYMSNIILNNGYGIMHRQDSIFPLKEIQFEGKTFLGPNNLDAYLKDLYKNYMEIPPVEKRQIHSIFIMPELIKE